MPKKKIRKPARAQRAPRRAPAAKAPKQSAAAELATAGLRKGEILAGISTDGKNACRLVVMEIDGIDPADHDKSLAHAKNLGGELPSRIDGLVLHATMKDKFKTDNAYWTSERYAGRSDGAWVQWFDEGVQGTWYRNDVRRVVVVRRLPL